MRIVLMFIMNFCFVKAILGYPISKLATHLAHLGEPKRDDYYNPKKYEIGSWQQ